MKFQKGHKKKTAKELSLFWKNKFEQAHYYTMTKEDYELAQNILR